MHRRTRIVATLGPATDAPGILEQLLHSGLDVARINFSHGTAADHQRRIAQFRQVSQGMGRNTAVLADLPGPKLRVVLPTPVALQVGQHVSLAATFSAQADLHITEPEAMTRVKVGERVLLDDGRLQGCIVKTGPDQVLLEVTDGGVLLPGKGVNLPDSDLALPAVTDRDRVALAGALHAGVDWLALSFVRSPKAAQELRGLLGNAAIPILAKMERPEAVQRAEEIIAAFDGIMVARGDLGVEIPLELVPHVQKRLINLARAAGKPVITATDMLDSMRNSPRPTRAEASDVANAVYDGTDATMLSGETAVGEHPVAALGCMDRILRAAEEHQSEDPLRPLQLVGGELTDHITTLTCKLASQIEARAIIAPTLTGRTAQLVARHRPRQAIVAVTPPGVVARSLAVVWGVQTVVQEAPAGRGVDRLAAALQAAFMQKVVQAGDLVVMLAGHPVAGNERRPTMQVVRVGAAGEPCEP